MSIRQHNAAVKTVSDVSSFWEWMQDLQKTIQHSVCVPAQDHARTPGHAKFQVGFIGYFGYELKRESLPGYSWAPEPTDVAEHGPDVQFMFTQEVLEYDHVTKEWTLNALVCDG